LLVGRGIRLLWVRLEARGRKRRWRVSLVGGGHRWTKSGVSTSNVVGGGAESVVVGDVAVAPTPIPRLDHAPGPIKDTV